MFSLSLFCSLLNPPKTLHLLQSFCLSLLCPCPCGPVKIDGILPVQPGPFAVEDRAILGIVSSDLEL